NRWTIFTGTRLGQAEESRTARSACGNINSVTTKRTATRSGNVTAVTTKRTVTRYGNITAVTTKGTVTRYGNINAVTVKRTATRCSTTNAVTTKRTATFSTKEARYPKCRTRGPLTFLRPKKVPHTRRRKTLSSLPRTA